MNLADWRRRIDEIDKKLVELLNERSRCALEIGKLKQEAKIPLYQPPFAACSSASLTKRVPRNATPWIMVLLVRAGRNELSPSSLKD